MKIVFVSNFLNHFTLPFCENLKKKCEDFKFVSTAQESKVQFRKEIKATYVLHGYKNDELEQCKQAINEADAVIFGDGADPYMSQRLRQNKLSFVFSERLFKRGTWRRFIPTTWYRLYKRFLQHKTRELYVLCASAYMPYDLSLLGFPINKCLRWGYFPYIKKYQDFEELLRNKKQWNFIWVGRLIPLKHPELGIYLVENLVKMGYPAKLDIVGVGPMEATLQKMISEKGLEENIHLMGKKSLEEVRECMELSKFFLFTSDFNEGWGAVVNEAMNSGCVVLCSHAAGSVPFLVNHKVNGMLFQSENLSSLLKAMEYLIASPECCDQFARQAYDDILSQWNAEQASMRFLELCECLLKHGEASHSTGPCSKADLLSNQWFKE